MSVTSPPLLCCWSRPDLPSSAAVKGWHRWVRNLGWTRFASALIEELHQQSEQAGIKAFDHVPDTMTVTTVRQAAAVCNVTPPVVRRWLSLG